MQTFSKDSIFVIFKITETYSKIKQKNVKITRMEPLRSAIGGEVIFFV